MISRISPRGLAATRQTTLEILIDICCSSTVLNRRLGDHIAPVPASTFRATHLIHISSALRCHLYSVTAGARREYLTWYARVDHRQTTAKPADGVTGLPPQAFWASYLLSRPPNWASDQVRARVRRVPCALWFQRRACSSPTTLRFPVFMRAFCNVANAAYMYNVVA